MVVVIDDRADVWQYSPNLVTVLPYHFFQGTGDINEPGKALQRPQAPLSESVGAEVHSDGGTKESSPTGDAATPPHLPKVPDPDTALQGDLLRILQTIHMRFFRAYDAHMAASGPTTASDATSMAPVDVKVLMQEAKKEILNGCVLLFSGVIPLETPPHR